MMDETELPGNAARLQAYFDGELDAPEAAEMAAAVERDAELRGHIAAMGTMRDLVNRSMEMRALEVPRARFEQIWDEIDREIERDARAAKTPAATPASFWARMAAVLKPFRMPLLAAAGAAAVAVVALNWGGAPEVNQAPEVASLPEPSVPGPATPAPPAEAPLLAEKPQGSPAPTGAGASELPAPRPADAEIHGIEFGGKQGRISHTGTVTVLYVEEDESQKSERSL